MAAKTQARSRERGLPFLLLAFRYVTGQHLDGQRRSDATFFADGTEAEAHYWGRGKAPWWAMLAGWKRAAIRLAPFAAAWAWAAHRAATERLSAVLAGVAAACGIIRGIRWREEWAHYRSRIRPLHYALAGVLDAPPKPRDWLAVPADYATNKDAEVVIRPPQGFTASDRDKDDIRRAVEAKLPEMEAPEAEWLLSSHKPRIVFKHSAPPPDEVTWEQIREHVYEARPDEFVIGIGKKGRIVKVSRQLDAPHLMIDCGSGAGKSNLAAFLMLQALIRGGWGLFLDAKLTSHPWVYKDMDAEFDQLPNAGYARRIPVMHDALMWLGNELARRYTLTERYINAKGSMLGRSVGPPIFVVAEELNLATPQIKEDWADRRALDKNLPKKSPALQALGALAFAGRAVDMHLIVIGQQLTAETLGTSGAQGGAVRRNMGIKLLARYDPNGWRMQAGDVPMPPSPTVPGRVQCLAGGDIHETQVPFVIERGDLRDLAASGTVAPVPPDMPGIGSGAALSPLVPGALPQIQGGPDQGLSVGRPTFRPPGTATLRELAAAGFYHSHEAAKKASTRDPDHPDGVGWEGSAKLYEISAVADYKAGKARKVRAIR